MLVVLIYYALFSVILLIHLSTRILDNSGNQSTSLQTYFVCEAFGSGMECDHSGFDQFGTADVSVLVFLLLFSLIPLVNLTFVINWTAAMGSCKHIWMKYYQRIISSHSGIVTNKDVMNTVDIKM